jgi:hypothetical protein
MAAAWVRLTVPFSMIIRNSFLELTVLLVVAIDEE